MEHGNDFRVKRGSRSGERSNKGIRMFLIIDYFKAEFYEPESEVEQIQLRESEAQAGGLLVLPPGQRPNSSTDLHNGNCQKIIVHRDESFNKGFSICDKNRLLASCYTVQTPLLFFFFVSTPECIFSINT